MPKQCWITSGIREQIAKDAVTKALRRRGYEADLQNGVVVIWTEEPMSKQEKATLKAAVREIGYRGSYGYRVRRQEA